MKSDRLLLVVTAIALTVGLCPSPADAGTIFNVFFDSTFDSTLTPPIVGSGILSVDDNLSDGSYLINNLTNLSISFTIGSETWTQDDMSTDPTSAIVVYNSGTDFYFSGPGDNTFFGGSVDFLNANSAFLTTEPDFFGDPPLNLYAYGTFEDGIILEGTYGATVVPEPTSLAAWCLLAVTGLAYRCRRHRLSC